MNPRYVASISIYLYLQKWSKNINNDILLLTSKPLVSNYRNGIRDFRSLPRENFNFDLDQVTVDMSEEQKEMFLSQMLTEEHKDFRLFQLLLNITVKLTIYSIHHFKY